MKNFVDYKWEKYFFAIIPLLIIPISGISIDIYVPSLPAVKQYFSTSQSMVQLTITTYMIGFGVMQLLSGSITDSIGRKKPFVISMLIYICATLLVPFSGDIDQLLFLRFIQGIAVGCFNVSMRTVISDLFTGKEFFKIINYVTIVWALGPIIAPGIGGYLQYYFGWYASFYSLAAYALIMFIFSVVFIPETLKEKKPFQLIHIVTSYREILFNLDYLIALICLGLLYSLLILFGVVGPFLIQTMLHSSSIAFGQIALLMGVAWFLGNTTNRFLIMINHTKKVMFCLWSMLVTVMMMLLLAVSLEINIYNVIIPLFIILYFGGVAFPIFFAQAIAQFPKSSGTANALIGAFMVLIAGCSSGFGTLLKSNTQIPFTITFMSIIAVCLFLFYLLKKKKCIYSPQLQNIGEKIDLSLD